MRVRRKLTKELLSKEVELSRSITDLMKRLGYKSLTGGAHALISKRVKEYGIDTSHFLSKIGALELFRKSGRMPFGQVLVKRSDGYRQNALRLRRALIEAGVDYTCSTCKLIPEWNGMGLVLEVDHRNNDFLDDSIENLRFLCPNCHSQLRHRMNKGWTTATGLIQPKNRSSLT